MNLKCNYHTHTKLCNHASGMPEDYVKKAIELKMQVIGFSDHNHVPAQFFSKIMAGQRIPNNMTIKQFKQDYLLQIEKCQHKYKGIIKIYKGLECEFLSKHLEYYQYLRSKVDYLGLGIHFFKVNELMLNSYLNLNYNNIMEYAKTAVEAMETGLFKFFYHPDVFMMSYRDENGDRQFDQKAHEASIVMIEAAIKNDVYLELNINGVRNSKRIYSDKWVYPCEEFWKIVSTYKEAKIVLGLDAHSPDFLDNDYTVLVLDFADKLGLRINFEVEI